MRLKSPNPQIRDQFNSLKTQIDNVPAESARAGRAIGATGRGVHGYIDIDIASTSSNSNAVVPLGIVVKDLPTQAEVQAVANKLDELINALRR